MAAVVAPRPVPSRSISSTSALASSTPPIKFKDSCIKCVTSRVKCGKERPTCSRCAKKGVSCEYDISRRAGRSSVRHSNIRSSVSHQTLAIAPNSSSATPPPSAPSTWPQQGVISNDVWMGNDCLDGDLSLLPDDIDWDSLLGSWDMTNAEEPQNYSQQMQYTNDNAAPTSYSDHGTHFNNHMAAATHGPVSDQRPISPGWTLDSPTQQAYANFDQHRSSSFSPSSSRSNSGAGLETHPCLQTALALLTRVSASPARCALQNRHAHDGNNWRTRTDSSGSASPDIEGVTTIASLNSILHCPCSSKDPYLLTIAALIALQRLSQCAVLVRTGRESVAQAVLGELQETRSLVYTFSQRVKEIHKPDLSLQSPRGRATAKLGHSLDQLQSDLCGALNRVSTDTIHALGQQ